MRFPAIRIIVPLCAAIVFSSRGENIINPPRSGWADVTKSPYSADSTGKTDVTSILQKAINDNSAGPGNAYKTIYFPNGHYLVSGALQWSTGNSQGPVFQGQSRKGVVIRLKDGTFTGAGNTASPKAVLATGDGVAQNFNKAIFNLTVNIGSNNPGACGVYFYSNNEGIISDVDIISEDGKGDVGLHMGNGEQGPCLACKVYIKGFKYGVWGNALNSITLSRISVEGQSGYGLVCGGRTLYIDSLTSVNAVPAVWNQSDMVLIEGNFTGGTPTLAAIKNDGRIVARNIVTTGYLRAITSINPGQKIAAPTGANITEYSSYGCLTLFNSPSHSINLPIKRPPDVEWEQDPAKWANLLDYKTTGRTDVQALQAAIDDPAKTSIIISSGPTINQPVYVRGNIKRICGTAYTYVEWAAGGPKAGAFVITDGTAPVVKIERLSSQWTGVFQQSGRTVVCEAVSNDVPGPNCDQTQVTGTGDVFLVDCCTRLKVANPKAHVWAWQFNSEQQSYFWDTPYDTTQAYNLKMLGGTAWIFGYKTEVYGTKAHLYNCNAEILGFYNYTSCRNRAEPTQFIVSESNFSLVSGTQLAFSCPLYDTLVTVIKGGVRKDLLHTQTNPVLSWDGYTLPLFTNYDSSFVGTGARGPAAAISGMRAEARLASRGRILVTWGLPHDQPVDLRIIDVKGKTACVLLRGHGHAGTYTQGYAIPNLAPGAYYLRMRAGLGRSIFAAVLVR